MAQEGQQATAVLDVPDGAALGQDSSQANQVLSEGAPGRPQKLTQEQKEQKRQQRREAREKRAQEKLKRTIEETIMTPQEREALKKAGKGLPAEQLRESFRTQHQSEMDAFLELHHTVAKAREELRAERHWSLRLLGAPLESVAYTRTLDRTWEALKKNEANIGNRPFVTIDVARKAAEQSFSWKHLIKGKEVALDADTLARQESASQAVQQLREIANKTSEPTDPISQAVAKDPKAQAFLKDVQRVMFSIKLSPQEMQSQIMALADVHGQAVGADFAKGISIVAESLTRAGVVMKDNIQTPQTEAAFQDLLNKELTQEQRGKLEQLVQITRNRDFYTKYSGSKLAIFTTLGAMHVPVVGGLVAAGFGLATSLYSAYYRVRYDEMMHSINKSKGTYEEGGDRNLLQKVFTVDWEKVNTSQSDSAKVLAYARIMAVSAATSAGAFILGHSTEFVDDLQNLFNGVKTFSEHAMNSAHNALSAIRDSVPNPGTGQSADVQNAFGVLGKGGGAGSSTDSAKGALEGLWNKITNGGHHMQDGGPEDHVGKDTTSQLKDTLGQKHTEPKIPLPPHKVIPQHPVGDATAADTLKHDVQQYIADKKAGNFAALKQDINNVRADEYVVNNNVIKEDVNSILMGHSDTANLNKLYEHIQEYDMENPAKHADDALKQLVKDLTDLKHGDISKVPADKASLQHALENAGMSKSDASSTVNKIITDWQNGQNITNETNPMDKFLTTLAKGPQEGAPLPGTLPTNEMQTLTVPGLSHFEQYSSGNIVYEGDTPGHNWQDFYTSVDHDGKGLIFSYNPMDNNGAHQYLVAAIDHQTGQTFFLQNGADVRPGDMTHMVTVVFPNGSTQLVPSGVVAQWLNIDQGKIDTYAGIIHAAQYSEQHGGAWTNVVVHGKNLGPIRWTGTGGDPAKGGANDLQQIFHDRFGVGPGGSPVDMRMGGGYFQNGVFHMAASNHNFDQSGIPSSVYQEQQVTMPTGANGTGPFPWGNGPEHGEHSTPLGEGLEKFGDYVWNHPGVVAGAVLGSVVTYLAGRRHNLPGRLPFIVGSDRAHPVLSDMVGVASIAASFIAPPIGIPMTIAYVLGRVTGRNGTPAPAATAVPVNQAQQPQPVQGGPPARPGKPANTYNVQPTVLNAANTIGTTRNTPNAVGGVVTPNGRQYNNAINNLVGGLPTPGGVTPQQHRQNVINAVNAARAQQARVPQATAANPNPIINYPSIAARLLEANGANGLDLTDAANARAMAEIMMPTAPIGEKAAAADAIRRAAVIRAIQHDPQYTTDQERIEAAIQGMQQVDTSPDAQKVAMQVRALGRVYTGHAADIIDGYRASPLNTPIALAIVGAAVRGGNPNENIDAGFRAADVDFSNPRRATPAAEVAAIAQAMDQAFAHGPELDSDPSRIPRGPRRPLTPLVKRQRIVERLAAMRPSASRETQAQVIAGLHTNTRERYAEAARLIRQNGATGTASSEDLYGVIRGLQAGRVPADEIQRQFMREVRNRRIVNPTPAQEAVITVMLDQTQGASAADRLGLGLQELAHNPNLTPGAGAGERAEQIADAVVAILDIVGGTGFSAQELQQRMRAEFPALRPDEQAVIAVRVFDALHVPTSSRQLSEQLALALAATGIESQTPNTPLTTTQAEAIADVVGAIHGHVGGLAGLPEAIRSAYLLDNAAAGQVAAVLVENNLNGGVNSLRIIVQEIDDALVPASATAEDYWAILQPAGQAIRAHTPAMVPIPAGSIDAIIAANPTLPVDIQAVMYGAFLPAAQVAGRAGVSAIITQMTTRGGAVIDITQPDQKLALVNGLRLFRSQAPDSATQITEAVRGANGAINGNTRRAEAREAWNQARAGGASVEDQARLAVMVAAPRVDMGPPANIEEVQAVFEELADDAGIDVNIVRQAMNQLRLAPDERQAVVHDYIRHLLQNEQPVAPLAPGANARQRTAHDDEVRNQITGVNRQIVRALAAAGYPPGTAGNDATMVGDVRGYVNAGGLALNIPNTQLVFI